MTSLPEPDHGYKALSLRPSGYHSWYRQLPRELRADLDRQLQAAARTWRKYRQAHESVREYLWGRASRRTDDGEREVTDQILLMLERGYLRPAEIVGEPDDHNLIDGFALEPGATIGGWMRLGCPTAAHKGLAGRRRAHGMEWT